MKKSELRNIIKESIKQLMTEQLSNPLSKYSRLTSCWGGYPLLSTPSNPTGQGWSPSSRWMTISGGTPSVGDALMMPSAAGWTLPPYNLTESPFTVYSTCNWGNMCGSSQNHAPQQANWEHNRNYPGLPSCPPRPYMWHCKPKGNHPKFGSKCEKIVDTYGPPNFLLPSFIAPAYRSLQDCMASGCEGLGPDDDRKTQDTTPLTTDPLSKMTQPDDEITRMQELANLK